MANQKIILIEDDEVLCKVIYEELSESGFDVHRAYDGATGLKMVQDEKPDLVLLDLIMPQKHGFDVLEELKKSPATRDIPVVVLTMLGRDDDIKKGLKLGANDYIVKSQHAVAEITEKILKFFGEESNPQAKQAEQKEKPVTEKLAVEGVPEDLKLPAENE